MQTDHRDAQWLNPSESVSITELAGLAGLTEADVRDLVDYGALTPADTRDSPWTFSANCVVTLRRACRLRTDLELDLHAVALALTLIEQIDDLEGQLVRLRAQLPPRID
jgi:chaperone modulatory protein CbpM